MKWKKRKKTVRERTWLAWFETSLSGPGGGNRRDSRRPHATAAAGAGAGVGPPAGMRVPGASCSGRWMREHFFASIGWFAFLRRSTPRKIATFFFLACRSKTRIAPRALLPRALFCRPALDLVSRTPRRRPRRCSCSCPSCLAPIACAGYPAGPARCARPTCTLPSTRAQRPPRGCTTTNSERLAAPIGRRLFPPTLAQICPRRRGIVRRPTPVAFLLQGGPRACGSGAPPGPRPPPKPGHNGTRPSPLIPPCCMRAPPASSVALARQQLLFARSLALLCSLARLLASSSPSALQTPLLCSTLLLPALSLLQLPLRHPPCCSNTPASQTPPHTTAVTSTTLSPIPPSFLHPPPCHEVSHVTDRPEDPPANRSKVAAHIRYLVLPTTRLSIHPLSTTPEAATAQATSRYTHIHPVCAIAHPRRSPPLFSVVLILTTLYQYTRSIGVQARRTQQIDTPKL